MYLQLELSQIAAIAISTLTYIEFENQCLWVHISSSRLSDQIYQWLVDAAGKMESRRPYSNIFIKYTLYLMVLRDLVHQADLGIKQKYSATCIKCFTTRYWKCHKLHHSKLHASKKAQCFKMRYWKCRKMVHNTFHAIKLIYIFSSLTDKDVVLKFKEINGTNNPCEKR